MTDEVLDEIESELVLTGAAASETKADDKSSAILDARRFDLENPPDKPVPVLLIRGNCIATAGNLVAITAQAKGGKTALSEAMMASLMEPTGDCLGIIGANPDGLPVVHFDTEQSPFDHHAVILRTLRRAGRDKPPDWFRSYCLADISTNQRRKALSCEMKRAAVAGKLRAVFLDGVADLCADPNEQAEAIGLIDELHKLAITFSCPIICVLHENPGENNYGKTRGHLGSQLERKAETNLRLSKDRDGITTAFTERSRHGWDASREIINHIEMQVRVLRDYEVVALARALEVAPAKLLPNEAAAFKRLSSGN